MLTISANHKLIWWWLPPRVSYPQGAADFSSLFLLLSPVNTSWKPSYLRNQEGLLQQHNISAQYFERFSAIRGVRRLLLDDDSNLTLIKTIFWCECFDGLQGPVDLSSCFCP